MSSSSKLRRTALACTKCRERKCKCSGELPSCQRCASRNLICQYAGSSRGRSSEKYTSVELRSAPTPAVQHDNHAQMLEARTYACLPPPQRNDYEQSSFYLPASAPYTHDHLMITPHNGVLYASDNSFRSQPGHNHSGPRFFDLPHTPVSAPNYYHGLPTSPQGADEIAWLSSQNEASPIFPLSDSPDNNPSSSNHHPSLEGSILLQPLTRTSSL
ncbi:hypothetical protein BDP27DRAFT_1327421 [Rhodocollybia butyracea]|uniref:Zn(2)-C6 fungal-type domain-containing protein n=1 Tax=Rhodocollybia butyracea TaxID=206335 RepID=A0A9P5U704_9AGAR|nr:hypothetical protein BDP27DRAFT_1327421 [Rhodocollybia butyracea]